MTKCGNAARYKGLIEPTCNGGNPCAACRKKYAENSGPVVTCSECGNDYAAGYCPHGN